VRAWTIGDRGCMKANVQTVSRLDVPPSAHIRMCSLHFIVILIRAFVENLWANEETSITGESSISEHHSKSNRSRFREFGNRACERAVSVLTQLQAVTIRNRSGEARQRNDRFNELIRYSSSREFTGAISARIWKIAGNSSTPTKSSTSLSETQKLARSWFEIARIARSVMLTYHCGVRSMSNMQDRNVLWIAVGSWSHTMQRY